MNSKVSVSARVVAAGPGREPGRARLTIALMPVKSGQDDQIDIANWPIEAHKYLKEKRLAIVAQKIALSPDVRPQAPAGLAAGSALPYDPSGFDKIGASVQKLWTQLATDALSGHENATKHGEIATFWNEAANVFKFSETTVPSTEDGTPQIPSVVSTARGDAAILHLLARAERLAGRLLNPEKEPPAVIDAPAEEESAESWEAEKGNFDVYGENEEEKAKVDKKVEEELKRESDQIANRVNGHLVGQVEKLKVLSDALSTSGGNILPHAAPASSLPPTLVGHSIGALFGAREGPMRLAQDLHLGMLLPDNSSATRPKGALSRKKVGDLESRKPEDPVGEDFDFLARTFLAAIRTSPMLSRLFRFVVDVDISIADAEPGGAESKSQIALTFSQPPASEKEADQFAFAFLGAGEPDGAGRVDRSKLLFTMVKATRKKDTAELTGFWPVTREEVDLRCLKNTMGQIRQTGAASQINGVVDLGQTIGKDKSRNPRFDLISIDPALAMEACIRNARKNVAVATSAARLGLKASTQSGPFGTEPETGLVGRGLSIVDRWRALSVAKEIMTARVARNAVLGAPDTDPKLRILDADDLTIGYRVDVAVRAGPNAAVEWRSLMEREIDYRNPWAEQPNRDDFRVWFHAMSHGSEKPAKAELDYEADRRRDYDAGIMMPTARRRLIADKKEMIHAEESIACWEGDPLGLNCQHEELPIRAGSEVAVARKFSLPSEHDEEARKAWPLRYGWAYRFGVRPVWLGGVSLSMKEAALRYDHTIKDYQGLALPSSSICWSADERSGWRRFLRHEPILPPVALLPEAVARETTALAPQSGVRAILRSLDAEKKADDQNPYRLRENDETWRVILPPRVSLDEAVRHGVFDSVKEIGEIAPGDLLDIDYDFLTNERGKGRDKSDKTIDRLQNQKNGFPAVPRSSELENPEDSGSLAFEDYFSVLPKTKRASDRGDAASQYYADPMADELVVAIRPSTSRPGLGYFRGAPRRFAIRPDANTILPVALKIKVDADRHVRTEIPTQSSFWEGEVATADINGKDFEGKKGGRGIKARISTLRLRGGETVAVDCWFVPSLAKLRAYFDWPEMLALKAAFATPPQPQDCEEFDLAPANPGDKKDEGRKKRQDEIKEKRAGGRLAYRTDLVRKLYQALKATEPDKKAIAGLLRKYQDQTAWVGLGGITADPVAVASAADILHQHILKYPLPEIAAVRTIEVVHAVARPPRKPAFEKDEAIYVLRSPSDDKERKAVLEKIPDWVTENSITEARFGKRGDDGIVFAGPVMMDRDTCRQLEIRAHCVSPARTALDDARLGRTELQRLLGEWPDRVVPEDAIASDGENKDKKANRFALTRSARFLFGFDVDVTGRVYLPKQWITLLQLDDLTEPDERKAADRQLALGKRAAPGKPPKGSNFAGLERLDLADEQLLTLTRRSADASDKAKKAESEKHGVRAAPLDRYSDRMARKVTVALRATSRFDVHFIHLNTTKDTPVSETQFPPNPDESEQLITRRSYEQELDPFLPSPDQIDPKTQNNSDEYKKRLEGLKAELRTLWIPSTIAPAKPQVHTVLPAYMIDRPTKTGEAKYGKAYWRLHRKPCVRILLDRPWYSSGEGERLGVVLWPPQLLAIMRKKNGATELEDGKVPRSVLHRLEPTNMSEQMQLADFADEDLGTGGKFTTRWGADPIRRNDTPIGPFLSPFALSDLPLNPDEHPNTDLVGFLPNVAVPLDDLRKREEESEQVKDTKVATQLANVETAYESLAAALITYVPRFDVESEKWFVDVALNPGAVVEPFVRLGLVRYQAEAARELRVSAPVAVWAQVLPSRTVEVWATRNASGQIDLEVSVGGNAGGRSEDDSGKGGRVYPRMRISVIESSATPAGMKSEKVVEAVGGVPAVRWAETAPHKKEGEWASQFAWRGDFRLPAKKAAPLATRPLSILVEEVDDFLSTADDDASPFQPSTPSSESVPAKAPESMHQSGPLDLWIIPGDEVEAALERTGPRFLSRIDIEV